jgi:hypothetical protein
VPGVARQIRVEPNADRFADVETAVKLEACLRGDEAAAAIRADQVFAADLALPACRSFHDPGGDAVAILHKVDQFVVEADIRAVPPRGVQDDRLQLVLRDVASWKSSRGRTRPASGQA